MRHAARLDVVLCWRKIDTGRVSGAAALRIARGDTTRRVCGINQISGGLSANGRGGATLRTGIYLAAYPVLTAWRIGAGVRAGGMKMVSRQ